jgi:flavin reductase (DIM6/NTAB) family NADH-FMN oxidoreductase RutF
LPPAANLGGGRKDSCINAEETGEFVVNMATWELRDAVKMTADIEQRGIDEMEFAGLERAPSRLVKPPRVAASPVQFECVHHQTVVLPGRAPKTTSHMVIGMVIGVHIKDEFITDEGIVDILKIRPLARLGYLDYTTVDSVFGIGHKGRAPTAREQRVMPGKAS